MLDFLKHFLIGAEVTTVSMASTEISCCLRDSNFSPEVAKDYANIFGFLVAVPPVAFVLEKNARFPAALGYLSATAISQSLKYLLLCDNVHKLAVVDMFLAGLFCWSSKLLNTLPQNDFHNQPAQVPH